MLYRLFNHQKLQKLTSLTLTNYFKASFDCDGCQKKIKNP